MTSAMPHEETKTIALELHQLRMLHAMRFKSKQEKRFQNMSVTIQTTEREVIFDGKKSDIAGAEKAMDDIVKNMKSSHIQMSVHMIGLMKGITMIRHLVDAFRGKDIFAVYADVEEDTLGVYALSDEHLKNATKMIRSETDEKYVDADSADRVQTREWVALRDQLQSQYEDLLAISETGSRVIISGTMKSVAIAKVKIEGFLAEIKGSHLDRSAAMTYITMENTRVQVVQGDLTTFQAGAIVNSANGELKHNGGLAKAIADAGGPEIQRECKEYVKQHGHLNPGQVHVSPPGRLPCKKVIHAVGPLWQVGNNNAKNDLREAVYESMMAAHLGGLSSIALPALSSGNSGFPIETCTEIIIRTLRDFLEDHKLTCVKKVSLVDPGDRVVNAFHKSLRKLSSLQRLNTSDHSHKESTADDVKLPSLDIESNLQRAMASDQCQGKSTADDIKPPRVWSAIDKNKPFILVKLAVWSKEYKDVEKYFTKDARKPVKKIHDITRIQNETLYRRYMLCKNEIEKHHGEQNTIRQKLWYNTTSDDVSDINASGFKGNARRATPFDEGICFTVKPSSDKRAKGKRYIYQARVITGRCTVSSQEYHDETNNQSASARKFDSLVDNADDPTKYVVFSSDQAYPEYLITFG